MTKKVIINFLARGPQNILGKDHGEIFVQCEHFSDDLQYTFNLVTPLLPASVKRKSWLRAWFWASCGPNDHGYQGS